MNYFLVNQQNISQLKMILGSWKKSKKNLVKKILVITKYLSGSDPANMLLGSYKKDSFVPHKTATEKMRRTVL